jgi:hypothetical protein
MLSLFLHCGVVVVVLKNGNSDLRLKRTFKCEILLRLVDFAGATETATISKL